MTSTTDEVTKAVAQLDDDTKLGEAQHLHLSLVVTYGEKLRGAIQPGWAHVATVLANAESDERTAYGDARLRMGFEIGRLVAGGMSISDAARVSYLDSQDEETDTYLGLVKALFDEVAKCDLGGDFITPKVTPAEPCTCRWAADEPRWHALLLSVEDDLEALSEVINEAVLFVDPDEGGGYEDGWRPIIVPEWPEFAAVHNWRRPELVHSIFRDLDTLAHIGRSERRLSTVLSEVRRTIDGMATAR